ncbi:MAG TPA: 2-phosphosulfolactate phosphatase [Streptosporangiaceae bacterium]|nr:2-phosphosulfolactate phosphatase [Streptosporangiaceae bacterium]
MADWVTQAPYGVRFEWGLAGAMALGPSSSCLVVVDVLSFTTSVSVAVEAGTRVYPYAWQDRSAADFARRHRAELAAHDREDATAAPWSLSPAGLRRAPFTERLVLPSPNGSSICAAAAASGATVIAACLRNAGAVGSYLTESGHGKPDRPVTVIAAGERWPDGGLRPSLEDLLGAGAVISALSGMLSPEARAARACFAGIPDTAAAITACASGQELIARGFADDVAIAVETATSPIVPVLTSGAFAAAPAAPAAPA